MRTRKFRVWDRLYKKMIYPVELWFEFNSTNLCDDWRVIERTNGIAFNTTDSCNGDLMDWVGIDKNKKDIYEGDKLLLDLSWMTDIYKLDGKVGIVRYESDYGGWIVECEYSRHQHYIELGCDVAFTGEVVGNIYEDLQLEKKLYCGDSGLIAEELMLDSAISDLDRKCFAIESTINDGTFILEEALNAYGVTKEEYNTFLNKRL